MLTEACFRLAVNGVGPVFTNVPWTILAVAVIGAFVALSTALTVTLNVFLAAASAGAAVPAVARTLVKRIDTVINNRALLQVFCLVNFTCLPWGSAHRI